MSDWISDEDKLPENGQMVVWYHPEIYQKSRGMTHSEYYRAGVHDLPNRPASHWMPLEPPR